MPRSRRRPRRSVPTPPSAAAAEGATLDWQEAATYAARARGERKRPSHGWAALTPTEQQVVALVADGLTNPQIAERLLMGRATVKTHLDHVFAKTGLHSRTELAAEFVRRHPTFGLRSVERERSYCTAGTVWGAGLVVVSPPTTERGRDAADPGRPAVH